MNFGGGICANCTKNVRTSQRIQAHRRPAPGHRSPGQRVSGRQSIPDFTGGYGFREDLYHGQCDSAAEQAHIGNSAQ